MGAFAPAAVLVVRRLGLRYAIVASTAAIGAGGILRAVVPGTPAVLLFTIPVGIGIGLSSTLLPIVVRQRLGHRTGFATGVYSSGIVLGSGIGALVAVPLARLGGNWQTPFAVISAVSLALLPAWLLLSRDLRGPGSVRTHSARLPLRSRAAWWLVVVFALQ